MGKIKQGILGGFSGTVANVVGSSWKGTAVIKSRPLSVANPRTAAQVGQRNNMTAIVALSQPILVSDIKPLWDRFAQGMSGYNSFVKTNISSFTNGEINDFTTIKLSTGKMAATVITGISLNAGRDIVNIVFSTTLTDAYMLNTDDMYAIVIVEETGVSYPQTATVKRTTGLITVTLDEALPAGYTVHAYLAARRVDGTVVSNSYHLVDVF